MAGQPHKLAYDSETYLTVSTHLPPSSLSSPPSPDDPFAPSVPPSGPSDPSLSHQSSLASLDSSSQTSSTSSSLIGSLRYVGPVGQLGPDEHLFKLPVPSSQHPSASVQEVKEWLEAKEGVQAVEVMVPQKRVKKSFEG